MGITKFKTLLISAALSALISSVLFFSIRPPLTRVRHQDQPITVDERGRSGDLSVVLSPQDANAKTIEPNDSLALELELKDLLLRSNLESAEKRLSTLTGVTRNYGYQILIRECLSQRRVIDASHLVLRMPFCIDRLSCVQQVASVMIVEDFNGARLWLSHLEEEGEQPAAIRRFVDALCLSRNDTDLSVLLDDLKEPNLRVKAIDSIVSARRSNLVLLDSFINSLNDGERGLARMKAISYDGGSAVSKVGRITTLALPDSEIAQGVSDAIKYEVQKDPAAFALGVKTLPDSQQKIVVPQLVSQWFRIDTQGVSTWIFNLPQNEVKDAAVSALVTNLKHTDREAAKQVAMWTSNIALQEKLLRYVAPKGR